MTSRTRAKLVRERSLRRQQLQARRNRKQLLHVERLEDRRLLAADFIPNEVLVQFSAGMTAEMRAETLPDGAVIGESIHTAMMKRNGSGVLERIVLDSNMSVDQAVSYFSTQNGVLAAEPNYVFDLAVESDDPYYTDGSLWGMYGDDASISPGTPANEFGSQAEKAWNDNNVGSSGVYVGIIDTGIQWDHPDLVDNIWVNPFDPTDGIDNDGNGYIDDTNGWDFSNDDRIIFDDPTDDSHGTHVAGTIGGSGGNSEGVAGVNWDVSMIGLKIFYPFSMDQTVKAYDYLSDLKLRHGLDIVASSNSWRGYSYSAILHAAINRGAKADILMIGAAGNESIDNDVQPPYPASLSTLDDAVDPFTGNVLETAADYDGVIAVASIQSDGDISGFSNYGATSVDIAAPGSAIYSTLPTDTYGSYDGTSMATPHVSGAAALYKSLYPTASADEVKRALLDGARFTPSLAGLVATNGRLDVSATLALPPIPKITIGDEMVVEGDSGTVQMTFTVRLSKASADTITVDYATIPGTATADVDYITTFGTLTFDPGETEKTIVVDVIGDLEVELRERFNVILFNQTNAIIPYPLAIGEIYSEDLPDITIQDVSIIEGNSGYKSVYFTISLNAPHSENVSIIYATEDGTAKAGGDYQSEGGNLVIPSGQRTGYVRVNIIGDSIVEDNETFSLRLFAAQQGTLMNSVATATIINDDSMQGISIGDGAVVEGNTGRKNMYFSIQLAQPSKSFITIHYATMNGTATAADRDYVTVSGQVSIRPGSTSATVAIPILGDRKAESDEVFYVQIVRAFGATINDGLAVGTIYNDDAGKVLPPPPPVGGPTGLAAAGALPNQPIAQPVTAPNQGGTVTLSALTQPSGLSNRAAVGSRASTSNSMTQFLATSSQVGPRRVDSFADSVDLALVALLKDGERLAKLN